MLLFCLFRLFYVVSDPRGDELFDNIRDSEQTFGRRRLRSRFNNRQELPNCLAHSWVVGYLTQQRQVATNVLMENFTEVEDVDLRSVGHPIDDQSRPKRVQCGSRHTTSPCIGSTCNVHDLLHTREVSVGEHLRHRASRKKAGQYTADRG